MNFDQEILFLFFFFYLPFLNTIEFIVEGNTAPIELT